MDLLSFNHAKSHKTEVLEQLQPQPATTTTKTMADRDPEDRSLSESGRSSHDDSSTNTPTSSKDPSTSTGTSYTGSRRTGVPEEILASKETSAVKCSRMVMIGVLLSTATAAGVMAWHWTKDTEQTTFENQVRPSHENRRISYSRQTCSHPPPV